MRKRWLIGLLIAAVALATIGGVALADTGDVPPVNETADSGTSITPLLEKVADILGVEPTTLNDAYQQAREDLSTEGLWSWLDTLVENGNLTEDQAAEIESWLYALPDAWESVPFGLDRGWLYRLPMGPLPLVGDSATFHSRMAETLGIDAETVEQAFSDALAALRTEEAGERLNRMLGSLVEQGVLTDDEAGDLRQWFDQRPEAADKLPGGGCFGMPQRGTLHAPGAFSRGRTPHARIEAFGNGNRFKFEFRFETEDGAFEFPSGGRFDSFKWFGSGHGFGFPLPPVTDDEPAPMPAPTEGSPA